VITEACIRSGYQHTDIGAIPDDWRFTPIGSFALFQSGAGISVSALSSESSDTSIPVFGGNGIAGYTKRELVNGPVVVIGRVGQKCGETYLTTGAAWVTDNALYPRRLSDDVDTRFLAYALKGAGLNDARNRNDLPLVTQSILHSFSIPLPPTRVEQ
jgi:type I restriction enzyme, S subunit